MRKFNFLFCIFFLTSLFISCEHSLDVKPHGNQETSTCTVIKGFLTDKFSGAAPADFENLQPSQNSSARNAIPEVTINDLQYEIYACKYDSLNGTEDTSTRVDVPDDKFASSTMTFEIKLPDAVWKIHAIGSDDLGNILVEGSSVITINSFESSGNGNDTDQTINISLHLSQSATGTGTVNLPFTFESGSLINYIEATWKDLDGDSHTKTMLPSSFIFDMNGDDHWGDSEIPSGVYKVTFRFYNSLGSTSCLYVIPEEEIMVLPGQTTSKWINNANSQYISDSGSFSITNEMIRAAHKNVYVEAKNDASDETADPDPDSTGSRYEPFSSIRKAFDYFAAIDGDHPESIEHQIIVSGEISVTQKYDSSKVYYFPVTNQKLTIKGLNSSTPGTIKCALDNNNDPITPGCAFFVAEDAILELGENLTVSHFVNNTNRAFNASSVEGNGGAVYIDYGGQLILNSCKIKNCKASCGSAIFLYSDEDIIFSGRPQVDGYTYLDGFGSFYLENDFDTTSNNNKYYVSFNIDEDHQNTYKIISKDSALSSYDYNTNFEVCGYSGVHFPGYFPINQDGEIIGSIPTPQVTASMPSTIYVGTNILDDYDYDGIGDIASRYISIVTSGMGECDDIVDVSYTWEINGVTLLNSAMSSSPFAYSTVDFCEGVTKAQVKLRNDFGQSENYEWSINCDSKYNSLGTNYQSGTLGTVAIVDGEGTPVSILQKSNASTKNIIYSDFIGTDIVQTCINQANSQTGLSWRLPTVAEAVSISFACNFDYDIIWLEGGYVIDISSGYFLEGDTYDIPDFAPSIRLIADVSSTPPVIPGDTVYTTWNELCNAVAAANGADAAFYVDGELVAYSTLESMGKVTLIPYGSTCTIRRNSITKDIVFNCSELVLQGSEDHKFILDGNNVSDSNSFINVGNDCAANLNYVTIKNCKSNGKGSAIYSTGTVNLENCDFNNNSSTSEGGAVYVKKNLTVNTCTFTENTSSSAGGAIAIDPTDSSQKVNILNSTFTKNIASGDSYINGGAVYIKSQGNITISDTVFIQNEAEGEGAAIALFSNPTVTLNNLELSGNIKTGPSTDEGIYASLSTKMTLQGQNIIPYLKYDIASNSNNYIPIKLDSSFTQNSSVCLAFSSYTADDKVLSSSNPNLAGSISIYNSDYEVYYDSSVSGYKLKTATPPTSLDNINPSNFTGFVEGETYSIGTEQGFKNFAQIVNNKGSNNATFKLTSNIELTGEWTPISGTANNGFLGTFDGNNKSISGLNLTGANNKPTGIFGKVGTNSVIKNVIIKGSVTGTDTTGALVGQADGDSIRIENCINYASVKGTTNVGGLVGKLSVYSSIIKNCINYGDVTIDGTTNTIAGGIVGFTQGTVENCANLGNIKASDFVGGLIGSTANDSVAIIKNSYNAGKITVTGGGPSKYGAICGYKPKTMENVWYEQNSCSKNNAVWGGASVTDTELHEFYYKNTTDETVKTLVDLKDSLDGYASTAVNYTRWMGTYNAYPVFSGNYGSFNEELTTIVYANTLYTNPTELGTVPASGTKCAVGSQNDLIYMNTLLNDGNTNLEGVTFIVLTDDITVSNWTPIGSTGTTFNHGFRGIFDGNGCTITISGLNQTGSTEDYGLFGYVQDAEIRNLTVKGNYQLSSKSNVGGIVGRVCVTSDKKVIIENCNSYVSITDPYSQGSNYGGIVGKVDNYAGTEDFIIRNCNNYGNISCKTSAGGILGYSSFKVVINNCMNNGKISIQDVESGASGGIVGKIDNDDYASIENNVNTGEIVSGSSIVGACPFISSKSFTNNFYLNQTGLNVIGNNTSYNDCYSIEKSGNTYVLVAGQDLEGDVLSLLIDNAHNNGWADWTTDTSGNLMVAN